MSGAPQKARAREAEDEDERDARLQKQRHLSAKAKASTAVREAANTERMDAGDFHGFTRADALDRPLEFWRCLHIVCNKFVLCDGDPGRINQWHCLHIHAVHFILGSIAGRQSCRP